MAKPLEQTVASPTHILVADGTAAGSSIGPVAIESLVGSFQGPKGDPGSDGSDGADGLSAYEIAVAEGFVGDVTAWLASLVGEQGEQGIQGEPGANGADGNDGAPGPNEVTTTTATDITGLLKGDGSTVSAAVAGTDYQSALVSGTNIKTVNSTSLLGSGDITIGANINGGTAAVPGLAVVGDTDTGIYSNAANTIGISAGGVEGILVSTAAGVSTVILAGTHLRTTNRGAASESVGIGRAVSGFGSGELGNFSVAIGTSSRTTANNTCAVGSFSHAKHVLSTVVGYYLESFRANSVAIGVHQTGGLTYSPIIDICGTSSGQTRRQLASLVTEWVDSTDATRKARVKYTVHDTVEREFMRGEASGTAALIGFLGASAVSRQVIGDAATDEASAITLANNIRTALINLGLCSAS